ncbi:MAG: RagB/SusD family nutrient uptake outer membrane protein [Prevotella sp.]|nr:RagB/SusD family nutrient uptake outer membrane protein [Prevotella sp.]
MKKYIGLSLATICLGLASCSDYLDKMPDNRATITTTSDINSILISAYPTAHYAYIAEYYSDNVAKEANPTYTTYQKIEDEAALWRDITYFDPDGDSPYALWEKCYEAIASANLALETIEQSDNKEELNGQKGEALMCRAYAHWVLASVFCQAYSSTNAATDLGVPYVTKTQETYNESYYRGTLAETYAAIDKDIQEALPIMNDGHITIPKYHFTKKAALAFATRFYLYYVQPDFSNYDKVINYANQVLTSRPEAILRDWATVGAKAINGSVRAMAYTSADDPANLLIYGTYSIYTRAYGPYGLAYKYCHNTYIANNQSCAPTPWGNRNSFYFNIPRYTGMPKIVMAKMAEYFEYTDVVNGIGNPHVMYPALTSDEVLINRAEAYVMKKQYASAVADLNLWGTRFYSGAAEMSQDDIVDYYSNMAYYTVDAPTPKKEIHVDYSIEEGTQESLLQATIAVRRILSLHEGNRLFDIKRFGLEMDRVCVNGTQVIEKIDHTSARDKRLAVQLPSQVINAGLESNPR